MERPVTIAEQAEPSILCLASPWEPIVPLDTAAKRLLDMLAAGGMADIATMTPQQMRDGFRRLAKAVDVKGVPTGEIVDGELPGPGGPLPYRIYRPQHPAALPLPALVFFHGAAAFGDIETMTGSAARWRQSGCAVISIGYRRAPEHRFPAAVEDSYAATQWVVRHAAELVSMPIASRSAGFGRRRAGGGGLPNGRREPWTSARLASAALSVMNMRAETPSRRSSRTAISQPGHHRLMLRHYCGADVDIDDPRLSPLRAVRFSGLPPAHIHTAEFDPLRDEGEAYAKLLRHQGVTAQYTCHAGMIHYFYAMAGAIPAARTALKAAAADMRAALVAGQNY